MFLFSPPQRPRLLLFLPDVPIPPPFSPVLLRSQRVLPSCLSFPRPQLAITPGKAEEEGKKRKGGKPSAKISSSSLSAELDGAGAEGDTVQEMPSTVLGSLRPGKDMRYVDPSFYMGRGIFAILVRTVRTTTYPQTPATLSFIRKFRMTSRNIESRQSPFPPPLLKQSLSPSLSSHIRTLTLLQMELGHRRLGSNAAKL